VNDHAGVPVLAHPFRVPHGAGKHLAETAAVRALEGANGHTGEFANAKADLLAAQRRIGSTGGSDAHRADGVGRAYTLFAEEVDSVDGLLEQLRRGHCRGSGRSLTGAERFLIPMKSAGLRISRGFRPV
jgi:hypothetical protein